MNNALVVVVLLLAACSEFREESYDSVAEAIAAGAVDRGWLPPQLPKTSRMIREAHELDTNLGWIAIQYDSAEYGLLRAIYQRPEWMFVPYDTSRLRVRFPDPPVSWWPADLRGPGSETPHTDVYTRLDLTTGHRWWVFVPPTQTEIYMWHAPES